MSWRALTRHPLLSATPAMRKENWRWRVKPAMTNFAMFVKTVIIFFTKYYEIKEKTIIFTLNFKKSIL